MSWVRGVHHVNLECKDLEATLAWYRDIFGLEDLDKGPGIGRIHNQLFLGENEIHFSLMENPVYQNIAHPAFELTDFDGFISHLKSRGVELEEGSPVQRVDGSWAAFFRDLEGNRLEVVHHKRGKRWARDDVNLTPTYST